RAVRRRGRVCRARRHARGGRRGVRERRGRSRAAARRAHRRLARGARPVIVAAVAAAAIGPEPHDARLLGAAGSAVVAVTPEGTRRKLIDDAQDAAYSPDGTLVAFVRGGDLWLANADGSGRRKIVATPNVVESRPSWLPDGRALVYTADIAGRR